jgi:hypothetical protein
MTFEVTDNPMNLHLLSFNHALRTYFDFTKIWANNDIMKMVGVMNRDGNG